MALGADTITRPAEASRDRTEVLRVLVCENDPAMRDALADFIADTPGLELAGTAADADGAAALAERTDPDAVILDVRMPGGGGSRAARLIRARRPRARLIALSAYSDLDAVIQMLRAGVSEYLVKGASDDDLVEAIRRTGRGRIALSPSVLEELAAELAEQLESAAARADDAERRLRVRTGSE